MTDDVLNDPDLVAMLRTLGARERSRPQPLCPRCGKRPQTQPEGWCTQCLDDQHEAAKARKRRWWRDNGQEWRAARAAQAADQPVPPSPGQARATRAARARQARPSP